MDEDRAMSESENVKIGFWKSHLKRLFDRIASANKFSVAIYLGCLLLCLISIIVRFPFNREIMFYNSDASYHVLLTLKAYDATPFSIHKFLPLVTLEEKFIHWGATVPDAVGNFYYTSFASLPFFAAYLFLKIFHLPFTLASLYIFSSLLYLASLIFMILIFQRLFSKYFDKRLIAVMVSVLFLFQPEIMQSMGLVYWAHTLFMPIFLAQVYLFLRLEKARHYVFFLILAFLAPSVEWTGYISNFGFAIALLLKGTVFKKDKSEFLTKNLICAALVMLLTGLSLVAFLKHFTSVIDEDKFYYALYARFFARNSTVDTVQFKDLIKGYFTSYNYLIILIACLLVISIFAACFHKTLKLIKESLSVFIIFALPMLENLLMLEHAVLYSFDRIKGVVLLMYLLFVLLIPLLTCAKDLCKNLVEYYTKKKVSNIEKNNIISPPPKLAKYLKYAPLSIILSILVAFSAANIVGYKKLDNVYVQQADFMSSNKIIAAEINQKYNIENSILCQPFATRGYLNTLLDRGVYEHTNIENLIAHARAQDKKYVVYLVMDVYSWSIYKINGYVEYDVETGIYLSFDFWSSEDG